MALAHNSFFRGLNSIYLQSPRVTLPKDVSDFLIYCQSWFEMISHHHDKEEELFFPAIEKFTGDSKVMCDNFEGHKAFHSGLEAFGKFCYEKTPESYNAGELREIIDKFKDPFEKHMREEIGSLLALEKYGDELLKAYNEMEAAIIGSADKVSNYPFLE